MLKSQLTLAAENKRKMFYRWLAAAKKARHKRLQLQAKEEEFKFTVIAGAWDKWRERFQGIRLQPIVRKRIVCHEKFSSDALSRRTNSLSNGKEMPCSELSVYGTPKRKSVLFSSPSSITSLLTCSIVVFACCAVPRFPPQGQILAYMARCYA